MNDEDRAVRKAGRNYLQGQRKELGFKATSLGTNVFGVAASHGMDPTSLIGTIHGIQDVASNLRRQWHSADEEMSRAMREITDLYRSYELHRGGQPAPSEPRKSVKPSLKQVAGPVIDKAGGKFVSAVTNRDFIPTINGVSSRLSVCEGKSARIRTMAIYMNEKSDEVESQMRDLRHADLEDSRSYRKLEKELEQYRFSGRSLKRHGIRERYTADGALEKADDLDRQIAAARLILARVKGADVSSGRTEIAVRSARVAVNLLTMADGNIDIVIGEPAGLAQAHAGYGSATSGVITTTGYLVKSEESRAEVEKAIAAGKALSSEQRKRAEEVRRTVVEQSHGRSNVQMASYRLPDFDFEREPDGPLMDV